MAHLGQRRLQLVLQRRHHLILSVLNRPELLVTQVLVLLLDVEALGAVEGRAAAAAADAAVGGVDGAVVVDDCRRAEGRRVDHDLDHIRLHVLDVCTHTKESREPSIWTDQRT